MDLSMIILATTLAVVLLVFTITLGIIFGIRHHRHGRHRRRGKCIKDCLQCPNPCHQYGLY